MNYEFEQLSCALKITVEGRLVAACSESFQNQVLERMESESAKNLLLDLSKMTHIDSSGLGALVFLLQKASAKGGTVKLACLQPRPRIIFEITKVFRVFEIYDTVDAALQSFGEAAN